VGVPAGATFTDRMDGTARFHWVPLYGAAGDYTVAVTADDRAGLTVSATTVIHVAAATGSIALAQPDDMSVVAGTAASQILFAMDAGGAPLTFALDAGPSYASVTPLDPVAGTTRASFDAGVPASAAGAVLPVTVSVTDELSASRGASSSR